jgi:hypothetical protein
MGINHFPLFDDGLVGCTVWTAVRTFGGLIGTTPSLG